MASNVHQRQPGKNPCVQSSIAPFETVTHLPSGPVYFGYSVGGVRDAVAESCVFARSITRAAVASSNALAEPAASSSAEEQALRLRWHAHIVRTTGARRFGRETDRDVRSASLAARPNPGLPGACPSVAANLRGAACARCVEYPKITLTLDTCVSEAQFSALSRGELSPEAVVAINAHASRCATCYARLLRGEGHDTRERETGVLEGKPRWAEPEGTELDWQPGRDLGRYVILLTLGKGGMGVVYRAYDKELDRAVALKVLHNRDDEGSSSGGPTRLVREAQAMARLSHPNVVAVHDVVELERRVCVVMELVEGVTVREWLKVEPRPSWKEILRVFRAAGEGLAAAHEAKLIHRDFKPDNVLVAQDGRIRVTDFGIARLAVDETSESRTPMPPTAVAPDGAGAAERHHRAHPPLDAFVLVLGRDARRRR